MIAIGRIGPSAMTEKAWQAQVVQAARLCGWRCYHTWLSVKSGSGWPDLAILKGRVLIMAELKREGKAASPRQQEWLDALARVPGIQTFVWHPSEFDAVLETLRQETETG